MSACSGAHRCVLGFFLQYLDNCVCISYHPHVVPLVYVTLVKGSSGRRKVDRVKPCSCRYIHLFLFLCPGGTRWRVRRKDRQGITSVMSAKAKVRQEQTSRPKESPEISSPSSSPAFLSSFLLSLLLLSILFSISPLSSVCLSLNLNQHLNK